MRGLVLALLVVWLVYFAVVVLGGIRRRRLARRQVVEALNGLARIHGSGRR